jgi:hydroxyacylglutathione hydrolase
VREESEWKEAHIPDSVHVPYHDLHDFPSKLDRDRPVAAICSSGTRSATAASLLKAHGAGEVVHVVNGGVPQWGRLGHPLEEGA